MYKLMDITINYKDNREGVRHWCVRERERQVVQLNAVNRKVRWWRGV